MFSINCKGQLLSLDEPIIMGILNATPDSFSDGSLLMGTEGMMAQVDNMIKDGATIIDIGGQSTKPNSTRITKDEELERVLPIIQAVHTKYPTQIISIDTYSAQVAKYAVEAGASIINDISSGTMDDNMLQMVAALKVPYIMMHMQGQPNNMQDNPKYEKNIALEIVDYFINKIDEAHKLKILDIIIDPGFGFGKTIEHNFVLLKKLDYFRVLNYPLMVGVSRKSFIYKTLNTIPQQAVNGTTALNILALQNGAKVLRVHDVKEAKEVITLFNKINIC